MQQVKKAVIPAAGLGTRFLPVTKAQPKEMLPIVDKPTIQYIVEEAAESGIEDIIIVTGRGKRAIEDHFDKAYELEEILRAAGKDADFKKAEEKIRNVNIHYIRQKEALGLGHAIFCARKFIGGEPFAVMLGDDIVVSEKPCLGQLIEVYHKYHCSVVGIQGVEREYISRYGIIEPGNEIDHTLYRINNFVEKPQIAHAPSNLAIMGRYVLRPEVFSILEDLPPGQGGEIQLTDALKLLNISQVVLGYIFQGKRYDVGDKYGFVRANLEFALQRDDMRIEIIELLKHLMANNYGNDGGR